MKYYKIILFFLLLIQKDIYAQNDNHLYIIQQGGKYGLIDTASNIIYISKVKSPYNYIVPAPGYYLIQEKDRTGIISINGKFSIWLEKSKNIELTGGITENMIYIKDKYDHYGFMNKKGEIILAPQNYINSLDGFSEGLSYVGKQITEYEWKYGYIDTTGKMAIDFIFDDVTSFFNGFALVRKGDNCNIINKKGGIIKTFLGEDFDYIVSDGLSFKYKDKYGYINMSSHKIIPAQFDWIGKNYNEDLIKIRKNYKYGGYIKYKYGYINSKGDIIVKPEFDEDNDVRYIGDGLIQIKTKDYKYSLIDTTGKIIIEATSENWWHENGIIFSRKGCDSCIKAMDLFGNIIMEFDKKYYYSNIYPINKTTFLVKEKTTKEGYQYSILSIDERKKLIYSTNSDLRMKKLNDNLFILFDPCINPTCALYMLINKNGDILIPLTSGLLIDSFNGPLAKVTLYNEATGSKVGYIDRTGKYIWHPS